MGDRREKITSHILASIRKNKEELKVQFSNTSQSIGYFVIDDLLPNDLVENIHQAFPETKDAVKKKNLREYKYVGYQMNEFSPILEDAIYAFQDKEVVKEVAEICDIKNIFPDEYLYAGGISMMAKNNFLNPHLDNSHDKDRKLWRVLNLLYYVTPDWDLTYGGNLELWPNGPNQKPIEIESKCNRLVVMATHQDSWHSVNKVLVDKTRCCVSNYYFSENPLRDDDHFHVTSFRGRPTEKLKNIALKLDSSLRDGIRKVFKKGIVENKHKYRKD